MNINSTQKLKIKRNPIFSIMFFLLALFMLASIYMPYFYTDKPIAEWIKYISVVVFFIISILQLFRPFIIINADTIFLYEGVIGNIKIAITDLQEVYIEDKKKLMFRLQNGKIVITYLNGIHKKERPQILKNINTKISSINDKLA